MSSLRNFVIFVLGFSFIIFVVLFGRVPAFRGTPIGFLYRLLWIRIPRVCARVDSALTGGRGTRAARDFTDYLLYKNNPFVMIAYLLILTTSAILFLSATYDILPSRRLYTLYVLLTFPYIATYLCYRSSASAITSSTLIRNLHIYPHDRIIFYPEHICRTCQLPKPARSKHCSLCGRCVARMDHHCHWITNCVGRSNYISFLLLLVSLFVLIVYGAWLAYSDINRRLILAEKIHYFKKTSAVSSSSSSSSTYITASTDSLKQWLRQRFITFTRGLELGGLRIGGVGLLCALTSPLPLFMFAYHIYLLWAGMTTNESDKWAQLKDAMNDGVVYRGTLWQEDEAEERTSQPGARSPPATISPWPKKSPYFVVILDDPDLNLKTVINASSATTTTATTGIRIATGGRQPVANTTGHSSAPNTNITNSTSTTTNSTPSTSSTPPPPQSSSSPSSPPPPLTTPNLPPELVTQLAPLVDPSSWQQVWKLADVQNTYDIGFWASVADVWRGWVL